ncbi:MAG: cytochrome c [Geminicoccaceae bacterium]|nr:cytochrome c [Geminicoccaceae bacterium]MDW8341435.1 cytochrome c [Geminicoccaceae bacterium]
MRERAAAAVSLLLAALGRAEAEPAPAALAPARAAELVHLLRHDCGSCHGLFLKGGLGPPLSPSALAGKDPQALVLTVLEGRAGTPMPPWKGLLDEAEARFLVDLLLAGRVP